MAFYVYILKCADGSYYTGHTDDLEKRLSQHKSRAFLSCYTASRLPVELIYQQPFSNRTEALASERQIKGWSRRKKEAMIRGDWNEVSRLAQSSPVRPEPVKGQSLIPVRPELVEGHNLQPHTKHPSTSSG